jgi:hypothetical protein
MNAQEGLKAMNAQEGLKAMNGALKLQLQGLGAAASESRDDGLARVAGWDVHQRLHQLRRPNSRTCRAIPKTECV